MKRKIENKNLIIIILCLVLFFIISIASIYSSQFIITKDFDNLYIKQFCWYIIGLLLFLIILKSKNNILLQCSLPIYLVNIALLILVLFFGVKVNNARCWFKLPYLGSFQPSELMKISIILLLSKICKNFYLKENNTIKTDLKFIFSTFIIVLIPSILTFLEPDTGTIIFYLLIWITMLFISGLRIRWFLILGINLIICFSIFFLLYFNYKTLFVSVFGHSFFYRIKRLMDWTNTSGMQLENSMVAIGSAYFFGHGFTNTPIYFPEPYTDFIFSVFSSNFGFIGASALLLIIICFILCLINLFINTKHILHKLLISPILTIFIFSYIENISMTMGILPIMGIPLPFISYGGSNLITSFIMLSMIINIIIENKKSNT